MKADEMERRIQIQIVDDQEPEPDEHFSIQLLDEFTKEILPGIDTESQVTITDKQKEIDIVGFKDRSIKVIRSKKHATLFIERKNGPLHDTSFHVCTRVKHPLITGQAAIEDKDFTPMNKRIFVPSHVALIPIEIPLKVTKESLGSREECQFVVEICNETISET